MTILRKGILVLPLLIFTGCADADLDKVAKGLNEAAITVGTLQSTTIEANNQQLISEGDTRAILTACLQVDKAGKEAVAVTRQISALSPNDRTKILNILTPVIASVDRLVAQGVLNIQDQQTRVGIQALLLSLQTSLNVVQITLSSGG